MSILDRFRLDGKTAIVTGASSGLGVAFATGLAEAGADIAICARRVEKLEQTRERVEALGRRCVAVQADVANPDDCERVVAETVEQLGGVDVLINNAGIGTGRARRRARRPTTSAASSTSTSTARTGWRSRAGAR
jgi:NAD(P)-dependent dehydrogenase (short-subunit alcohol dehydrogenase family)